jgi:hypothetical protein
MANASLTGTQSGISVAPAAPAGLAANAVSSPQINLTWGASVGATGYEIERSLSATTGFTEVGTATTTSYSDTGLTAGTTYYYQVIATGGGVSSAASNTASATTSGTGAVTGSTKGSAAVAIGESGYSNTTPGSATPAGPMGVAPASQGTSSKPAWQSSVSSAAVSYRPVVTQARAVVLWGQKGTSLLS